jgi:hypothetical protein
MRELTRIEIMKVAAHTGADPRTVKSYLRNGPVQPVSAEAIRAALRALNLVDTRTAPQP